MGTQAQPGDPAASRDSQVAPGREALLFPSPETSQSWAFWDIWGPGQEVVQGGGQKPMENCPRGAPVRPRRSCLALERLAVRMECLGVQGTEDPRRGSLPGEENESSATPEGLRQGGPGPLRLHPGDEWPARVCLQGPLVLEPGWRLRQGRLDAGPYPSGAIPRTPRACPASPLQAVPGPRPFFPADPAAGPPDVPALGAGPATHPGA